jgi:hypothetical protein
MQISRLNFQSAYAYLLAAIELAEHAMQEEASTHRHDFLWQMQQLAIGDTTPPAYVRLPFRNPNWFSG